MLEVEKKKYDLYRVEFETRKGKRIGSVNLAVYQTSDRRDVDNQIGGVFLKKTYYGVCDTIDIRSGDNVNLDGAFAQVISVRPSKTELLLHLESVEYLDTGAYAIEVSDDV
jgi:hypothetical protein